MKGFPDLPPLWLAGFCILAWFLARELPFASVASPQLRLLGSGMSVLALLLIAWSAVTFARAKTTIEPHETPRHLITGGPFRFSRNPIYLAMVILLAGWVLWLGAVSGVILPGIFASLLSLRFIMAEEEKLTKLFGAEAKAYFAKTRRWL